MNIYALLVGIDEYVSPVPPLRGCVNDITAVREYLLGRVQSDGYQLHLRTLLNQEATRQAVIDGFRQHLCQAGSEDVAFFYYSGHGSQEQAPEEFWSLEPDRLNETLVCYDSRSLGNWDLADKELAQLIAEVAEKNPHIAIIMDCCHSGSGTRGDLETETAVRKAPIDYRQRPLNSFLLSLPEVDQLLNSRSLAKNSTGWTVPTGSHILLAACRDIEEAKEYNAEGQSRGAFSYFLLDTLKKANGSLSYRDLFKRTHALVRAKVTSQSPQIEAMVMGDLEQPFLGGAIAAHTPYFSVSYHQDYGWTIDGGSIHGIPQTAAGETTILALFPFDTPTAELHQLSAAIGEAEVTQVLPQLSKVQINGVSDLNLQTTFKAVITSLPLPPKGVLITGENAGVELARNALMEAGPQNQYSLYVREVTTPELAEFKLLARDEEYLITRPADDRPLVAQISGYNSATAWQAIQRLEHIARWTNIAELSSPATSRIPPDAVQMIIYQEEQETQDPQISLEYRQENGRWKRPPFKIKLKNISQQSLYCAVLDLTQQYKVDAGLFATEGVWLEPGQEAWALGGQTLYAEIPNELLTQGITEFTDIYKLIVSTSEFDARLLEQDKLDLPHIKRALGQGQKGTLNRLMHRIQSRDFSIMQDDEEEYNDWVTSQITITTIRPQQSIPRGNASIFLATGVKLQSHPTFKANAHLTTVNSSTRDVNNNILPTILQSTRSGIQSFQFPVTRGNEPTGNVLELTQVEDATVVTPAQPLKLIVDTPLRPDEQLLPISYDGEFFLPLGRAQSTLDGKTEIILERLTQPVSEGNRSLGGSIKILFQKIVSDKLGLKFDYPALAIADVISEETIRYTRQIDEIKTRVAQANRIVLYIHGFLGETPSIVGSVQKAKLHELYDLVLTFDYETLNTSIEENARQLKQKLAAINLGENHGKVLHIVAHSIGGLIARWFIEREVGNQVVQHLIMLGTPNAGSPWSTLQDWALATLSIGLNGLSAMTWPVPVLGTLLKAINKNVEAIEQIDVSLDQMRPDSELLKTLAASADPGVGYTIIAGDTSIIAAAIDSPNNQLNAIERLLRKLFNKTVALPFFGEPNDIFATVYSITNVSSDRQPQPQIQQVPCDHLVYFIHSAGIAALAETCQKLHQPLATVSPSHQQQQIPLTTAASSVVEQTSETTAAEQVNSPDSAIAVDHTTNNSPTLEEKPQWFIGAVIGGIAILGLIGMLISHQPKNPQPQNQNQPGQSLQK
nr:caspase family protein [Amazonocrinis nigriterrae]